MRDVGGWAVLGLVAVVAGFILIFANGDRDAFALGGAGLLVVGAVCAAVSLDDRVREAKSDEPTLPLSTGPQAVGRQAVFGFVAIVAGLVMIVVNPESDAFALGGAGLLGLGVLVAGTGLDDRKPPVRPRSRRGRNAGS